MRDANQEWDSLMKNYSKEHKDTKVALYKELIREMADFDNLSQVIGHLHNKIDVAEMIYKEEYGG